MTTLSPKKRRVRYPKEVREYLKELRDDPWWFRGVRPMRVNTPAKGNFLKTPLHFACTRKDWHMVEPLLAAGADPNAQDEEGFTPLHYGINRCPTSVLKVFLAYGASLSIENCYGGNLFDEVNQTLAPENYALVMERASAQTPSKSAETSE